MADTYTITITRQFGSLGRPIGMKLAEQLGVEFYDRDIVEQAAKDMNLPLSYVSEQEERVRKGFFYMRYPLGENPAEIRDKIYAAQHKIITQWARKSSSVIVGRCSDYILRAQERHLNFYIYAPYEARLHNCICDLQMKEKDAEKMIAEIDKARDAYHRRYAKVPMLNQTYNDFMLDSSVLGVDGTVEIMKQIIETKFIK
ncbi:MAG: AAA family ATPase [Lachnospiraceae bacterium]